jgi:hypothetical protein
MLLVIRSKKNNNNLKLKKMKKTILTFALGIFITVGAMAQSKTERRAINSTNKKIEQIEMTTQLSDSEKETYSKLNTAYMIKHFEIRDELKKSDPAKFNTERKANNADFNKKIIAAFGEARAKQIKTAAIIKKK